MHCHLLLFAVSNPRMYKGLERIMEQSIFKEEDKKKVEVVLLGQRLSLKSSRDEKYLQKLANFIADQIEEVRRGSRTISTNQSVLLVAIKIADMLKQREDELFELKDLIRKKASLALSDVESALSDLKLKSELDNANKDSIPSDRHDS